MSRFSPLAGAAGRTADECRDYYPQSKRWWVRLYEKGGKRHEMSADLDTYGTAAGLAGEKIAPLFPTQGGRGRKQLTGKRMTHQDARA